MSDCFKSPDASPETTDKQIICAALECTAVMLNINYGHNLVLMERCQRLEEYAYFIAAVRKQLDYGYESRKAIQLAADECIAQNKLADILSKNRREVIDMLLRTFDEEKYKALVRKETYEDVWEEAREAGLEAGLEAGRKAGIKDGIHLAKQVIRLSAQGLTIEEIAAQTHVALEQIGEILEVEPSEK